MNVQCHRELSQLGLSEIGCTLSSELIFGEYFCYFDSNRVAVLLQLQLYLDANRVLVRERVNHCVIPPYKKILYFAKGPNHGVIFKPRSVLKKKKKKKILGLYILLYTQCCC